MFLKTAFKLKKQNNFLVFYKNWDVWQVVFKNKKKQKEIYENMCNLKKYYIWRFSILVLDSEEKKGMISYSILFIFYEFFLYFP